jgi:hypothetical protein
MGLLLTLAALAMCVVPGDAVARSRGAAPGRPHRVQISSDSQTSLLLTDMSRPSERLPEGVPGWWDWVQHPRTRSITPLRQYRAFTAWGQLYQCAGTAPSPRATVDIRDLQAWVLLRNPSRWQRIQFSSELGGAAFAEDYAGPTVPGRYATSPTGTAVHMVARHNFHFWPDAGRVPLNASNVEAVTVAAEGRLEPSHAGTACLVLSVGGDVWKSLDATANGSASDVGIGRFKRVEDRWRLFTMTTASATVLQQHPLPVMAPAAEDF